MQAGYKNILVIGAGLSSSYLIRYLLDNAAEQQWLITVCDYDVAHAQSKVGTNAHGRAQALDINNKEATNELIRSHDLVFSMLPASMHMQVATLCLHHKKHLITASYISPEMQQLHADVLKSGLLFLNECGLDPGIDHLSAMKMIHDIQHAGGAVTSFKSFCGGLIAPEYDDNPWNYKFTWNPRNVVLAGQATARYMENGELKFIPPSRIFTQTETISVDGYGEFESYANRDSLGYIVPYGIEKASTVLRGTLRRKGYPGNWNNLCRLGLTDDTFTIHHADRLTLREFVSALTPGSPVTALEQRVCRFLGIDKKSDAFSKLKWLGLFEPTPITLPEATPAMILQQVLEQKWKLKAGELDMIVMHHEIGFSNNDKAHFVNSSLVVKGEDEVYTAMAKTVGLPMAIAGKLLLNGQIRARGVVMPITKEFYDPILAELENFGIRFVEKSS